MGSLRLWIILLIVPITVWVAASAVLSSIESDWYATLEREFGTLTEAQREAVSLDAVCADPAWSPDADPWCVDYDRVWFLQMGSVLTGIGSGALIFLIGLAGRIGQGDRNLLLNLFRPGLILTLLAVIGLVGVNAVLAIGAIYYVLAEFFGIVYPFVLLMIGIGAVVAFVVLVQAGLNILNRAETFVIGRQVGRDDSPQLWKFVESVSRDVGAAMPRSIVVGLDPNFFVTEADVRLPVAGLSGETLYISLPFCRVLTWNEFHAILAHEFAHFRGQDTQFSRKFYPIYRGAIQSLDSLSATAGESLRVIPVLPAMAVLSHFLDSFSIAERSISREREFAADRLAASVTSGLEFSVALVKVHTFGELWNAALQSTFHYSGTEAPNASEMFALLADRADSKDMVFAAAGETVSHPTDSHPLLEERLQALGFQLDEVAEEAKSTRPQHTAVEMIDDYQSVEKELTDLTMRLYRAVSQQRPTQEFNR